VVSETAISKPLSKATRNMLFKHFIKKNAKVVGD
jgi:hypothetical protein